MTESVHKEARSEEVVPEMRSASNKAYALLGVQAFAGDLDDASCVNCEEAVGSDAGTVVRARFHRFCALKEYSAPSIVLPIRVYFFGILGRRVRRIGLADTQERAL